MSYNLLAKADNNVNWKGLNEIFIEDYSLLEVIPIPERDFEGKVSLGISIPQKNCSELAWKQLERFLMVLKKDFSFNIFDLYYGDEIDAKLMDKIKEQIVS